MEDVNIVLAQGNTNNTTQLDGGGITLGSTDGVHFTFNNNLTAWESDINMNLISGKTIEIAGGADSTANTGVTLNETDLAFGDHASYLQTGDGAVTNGFFLDENSFRFGPADAIIQAGDGNGTTGFILDQSGLDFKDSSALIKFGTEAVISKDGLSTTSNSFGLYLGNLRNWCIHRTVTYDVDGVTILSDALSFGYLADGTSATSPDDYETKFTIAN